MADKTIRGPFGVEKGITTDNIGTEATGTTAVEYGDGAFHQTVITVDTTFPAVTGASTYGVGTLVYTFPDGAVDVKATYISMAITGAEALIAADTPEVGVGTTIGTGGAATIGAINAAAENMMVGTSNAAADCNGTPKVTHEATSLVIATGGDHTVYFNTADDWTGADTAPVIAGTIIIEWTFVV